VGCIIAEIPCIDQLPIHSLHTGQRLAVDGQAGTVEILS
jgi:predicted aconitase with swiveling domain